MENKIEKATARPWTLSIINEPMGNHKTNRQVLYKIEQAIMPLGIHPEKEHLENAELIVKAVNSYDALLEACKKARDYFAQNQNSLAIELGEAIANAEAN